MASSQQATTAAVSAISPVPNRTDPTSSLDEQREMLQTLCDGVGLGSLLTDVLQHQEREYKTIWYDPIVAAHTTVQVRCAAAVVCERACDHHSCAGPLRGVRGGSE